LGVGVLLAFCSTLLKKSIKGGLVVIGGLNLGGALDPVYSAISIAELAIEKGAETLLIPISDLGNNAIWLNFINSMRLSGEYGSRN